VSGGLCKCGHTLPNGCVGFDGVHADLMKERERFRGAADALLDSTLRVVRVCIAHGFSLVD